MSESLVKRLEYLGIADMDYLSARALLINGLTHTGLSKAAEGFEKLFKLFLLIEAKVTRNEHLTSKDLRQYEHKLVKLFELVMSKLPEKNYHHSVKDFFQQLENAYKLRYPESWKEARLINDFQDLDKMYCYFRNNITRNFPKDELEKTRQFGTFIIKGYTPEVVKYIQEHAGLTPKQILSKDNKHLSELNIDISKLP